MGDLGNRLGITNGPGRLGPSPPDVQVFRRLGPASVPAEKCALVLVDLQEGMLDSLGDSTDSSSRFARSVADVVARARRARGVAAVVFACTAFRRDFPECHPRNLQATRANALGALSEGHPSSDIARAVALDRDDLVVIKRRLSAFVGTDLDCLLRSLGVRSLALAGLPTSGAVLSTWRHAADLDYTVVLLDDLCRDVDAALHRVLVRDVFPGQGRVVSSAEWLEEVGGNDGRE